MKNKQTTEITNQGHVEYGMEFGDINAVKQYEVSHNTKKKDNKKKE